jgi:ligand-binding sensor domain-containing protein
MLDVSRQRFTDHALTIDNDVKTNNFKVIKLDGDSLVWFGTEAGVYKYKKHLSINDKDAWKFYSNKNGGFDDEGKAVSVSDILIDRSGIWFGTDEFITKQSPDFNLGGLYDFNRRHTWTRLSEKDGLPANGIYCLSMTGNKIWAGIYSFDGKEKKDYGKGLILIDRVTWDITHVDLNSIQIQSSKILSMYFDGSYMWLGTGDGVSRIRISNPLARWDGKKGMRRKR